MSERNTRLTSPSTRIPRTLKQVRSALHRLRRMYQEAPAGSSEKESLRKSINKFQGLYQLKLKRRESSAANRRSALCGDRNELPSVTFDEEAYQKALPFFRTGVAHFAGAGRDIADVLQVLMQYLADIGKLDHAAIEAMRPYVRRFTEDVRAGKEVLDAPSLAENLERDRRVAAAQDRLGETDVPAADNESPVGRGRRG
jgi:hypothetical protein